MSADAALHFVDRGACNTFVPKSHMASSAIRQYITGRLLRHPIPSALHFGHCGVPEPMNDIDRQQCLCQYTCHVLPLATLNTPLQLEVVGQMYDMQMHFDSQSLRRFLSGPLLGPFCFHPHVPPIVSGCSAGRTACRCRSRSRTPRAGGGCTLDLPGE